MSRIRTSCEVCDCKKFIKISENQYYRCLCGHGDVWHRKKKSGTIAITIKKLLNPIKKIFKNNTYECPICFENSNDMYIINCGHMICFECSNNIENCPFCRKYIIRKTKCFF